MPRTTRKQARWGKVRGWRSHSLACWDSEWQEWKRAAEARGKSFNGWAREWLNEGVKYDRLADRDEPSAG